MSSKLYNYTLSQLLILNTLNEDDFLEYRAKELLLQRVIKVYTECPIFRDWIRNLDAPHFNIALLDWLSFVKPEDLQGEFNDHEIMELLSEHEEDRAVYPR